MPSNDTNAVETATDNQETIIEVVSNDGNEVFVLETNDPEVAEEVIEAFSDGDGAFSDSPDEHAGTDDATDAGIWSSDENVSSDTVTSSYETETVTDGAAPIETGYVSPETDLEAGANFSSATNEDSTASLFGASDTASANNSETDAHAQAATDAQQQADDFVASGDYAAAEEARETAENESYQAGDDSMLHGSNATELDSAATDQQNADYYQNQEASDAQQGNYEAAKEDAANAADATGNADWNAGGADHTGQANQEEDQMDNAVWQQGDADYYAQNAEEYAAQGDYNNAETSAGLASEDQAAADYHGDLGEYGGAEAVHDSSSDVASGESYEAAPVDYSSVDHSSDYSSE